MKIKKLAVLLISTLIITGCQIRKKDEGHVHKYSTSWVSDDFYHYHECECGELIDIEEHSFDEGIIQREPTLITPGIKICTCSICLYEKTFVIPVLQEDKDNIEIKFTCINDFHGAVLEKDNQPGLSKVCKYLKDKKSEGNILIDSGDMWQGTFESNYSYGELVTRAFKTVNFDAHAIGNHEFDWGIDRIKINQELNNENYLCANIKEYNPSGNPSFVGDKYELGSDYNIVSINQGTVNEIKIGIIGVIGENQLTSIDSNKTGDIIFTDADETVISLANELRNDLSCDVVVATYHAPQDSIDVEVTNYVDAVFCGHSHADESSIINGVPFVQSGSNGVKAGNITLNYNKNSKQVSYIGTDSTGYKGSKDNLGCNEYIDSHTEGDDVYVQQLVNDYANTASDVANQQIGTLDGYASRDTVANMVSKGMYDLCAKYGEDDVVFTVTNIARNDLNYGNVKYSQAVTAIPFENEIAICYAKGQDIVRYSLSWYYYNPFLTSINVNQTYKVAVCSYVLFHMTFNEETYEKRYNYFPSMTDVHYLKDNSGNTLYYREGLLEQFRNSNGAYGKTVYASSYSGSYFYVA